MHNVTSTSCCLSVLEFSFRSSRFTHGHRKHMRRLLRRRLCCMPGCLKNLVSTAFCVWLFLSCPKARDTGRHCLLCCSLETSSTWGWSQLPRSGWIGCSVTRAWCTWATFFLASPAPVFLVSPARLY